LRNFRLKQRGIAGQKPALRPLFGYKRQVTVRNELDALIADEFTGGGICQRLQFVAAVIFPSFFLVRIFAMSNRSIAGRMAHQFASTGTG
jgi:hypothetical protein